MSTNTTDSGSKVDLIGDVIIAAVLLSIFVVGYFTARDWPFGAAMFPIGITLTGSALSLIVLFRSVLKFRGPAPIDESAREGESFDAPAEAAGTALMSEAEEEDYDLEYAFSSSSRKQWLSALGWVVAYFAGLWVVGALLITTLVTLCYLKIEAERKLIFCVVYTGILVLVIWAAVQFLQLSLPSGVVYAD